MSSSSLVHLFPAAMRSFWRAHSGWRVGNFHLVIRFAPGQVIAAAMPGKIDPAAVFACAKYLHDACMERADAEPGLNLSDAYQGMDGLMRELMRVAGMFEEWACRHVAFEEMDDVWPYLLEKQFGAACLDIMEAEALGGFDADDCLRVALKLRLPIRADGSLPLPVCVEAPNPLAGAGFQQLRIQTVRLELGEEGEAAPFTEGDDPFDENFGAPFFGVYGVRNDGHLDHIVDRATYQGARAVLADLLPGIGIPEQVVAFARPLTPRGGS